MKLSNLLFASVISASLVACGGAEAPTEFKKVIVFSSGKIATTGADVLFSISPSNQHNEQEFDIAGKSSIDVLLGDEKISFDVAAPGYYVINFKKDTLVGGIVNFGDAGTPKQLGADDVDRMIDSTKKLLTGENASDAARVYSIAPKAIKNVGESNSIKVFGPFSNIPYEVEVGPDGKAPEFLKFHTNPQKRKALDEMLDRLKQ